MSAEEKNHLNRYQNYRKREDHILKKLHKVVLEDNGHPTLAKRQYGIKGYRKVLVNEERGEYELRATYNDTEPLEESEPESDVHEIFTSKDHRAKMKFKRHKKRFMPIPDDQELLNHL